MRLLFTIYCRLFRGLPKLVIDQLWIAYGHNQHRPWFKESYGKNIFTADVDWMIYTCSFPDFFTDEGIAWIHAQLRKHLPPNRRLVSVRQFAIQFLDTSGRVLIRQTEGENRHTFDREDYLILRQLFTKQLAAYLNAIARTHCEDEIKFYLTHYHKTI